MLQFKNKLNFNFDFYCFPEKIYEIDEKNIEYYKAASVGVRVPSKKYRSRSCLNNKKLNKLRRELNSNKIALFSFLSEASTIIFSDRGVGKPYFIMPDSAHLSNSSTFDYSTIDKENTYFNLSNASFSRYYDDSLSNDGSESKEYFESKDELNIRYRDHFLCGVDTSVNDEFDSEMLDSKMFQFDLMENISNEKSKISKNKKASIKKHNLSNKKKRKISKPQSPDYNKLNVEFFERSENNEYMEVDVVIKDEKLEQYQQASYEDIEEFAEIGDF